MKMVQSLAGSPKDVEVLATDLWARMLLARWYPTATRGPQRVVPYASNREVLRVRHLRR